MVRFLILGVGKFLEIALSKLSYNPNDYGLHSGAPAAKRSHIIIGTGSHAYMHFFKIVNFFSKKKLLFFKEKNLTFFFLQNWSFLKQLNILEKTQLKKKLMFFKKDSTLFKKNNSSIFLKKLIFLKKSTFV